MNTSKNNIRSKSGFTLVEIVVVSILLGIFTVLTAGYIRDAASTGRANVLAKNAQEINNCINDLRASGATFTTAAYAVTNGSATAAAAIAFPATAVPADISSFLTSLSGAGVTSLNHTTSLARSITAASYTYTIANGVPVFTGIAGSTP